MARNFIPIIRREDLPYRLHPQAGIQCKQRITFYCVLFSSTYIHYIGLHFLYNYYAVQLTGLKCHGA